MDDLRYEHGLKIRAEILGPDYLAIRSAKETADPIIENWQRYLAEEGWGGVWDRPGLSRKDKSLVTISVLVAAGKPHELGLHLVGAIRNGWTPEELGEILIHLTTYAGWPSVVGAFRVFEEVLATSSELEDRRNSQTK